MRVGILPSTIQSQFITQIGSSDLKPASAKTPAATTSYSTTSSSQPSERTDTCILSLVSTLSCSACILLESATNMGAYLSQPVIDKDSHKGHDERLAFGHSSMQGWRCGMDDTHVTVLDLRAEDKGNEFMASSLEDRVSYFAVYDGHVGPAVSRYAADNTHKILKKQQAFKKGDFEQALKDSFLATDHTILKENYDDQEAGCTAIAGLIAKNKIYVANAGDSRSVLGVRGRAKSLSYDHKPDNEGEKERILAAGGRVQKGRINAKLALSRAFGDFRYKMNPELLPEQQIVTAFPDVITHSIAEGDEFLLIACDGIWDAKSSQSAVEFVRRGIAEGQPLPTICENLMDNCLFQNIELDLEGSPGTDNMTVIIVALLQGMTLGEWYKEIGDRVRSGDGPVADTKCAILLGPQLRKRYHLNRNSLETRITRPTDNFAAAGNGEETEHTPEKNSHPDDKPIDSGNGENSEPDSAKNSHLEVESTGASNSVEDDQGLLSS